MIRPDLTEDQARALLAALDGFEPHPCTEAHEDLNANAETDDHGDESTCFGYGPATLAALAEGHEAIRAAIARRDDDADRPLVLIDMTEGTVQAEYTYPGTGEPIVETFDFDADWMDDDRRAELIDGAERIAELIRSRSTHPDDLAAAAQYEADAAEWRQDADDNRREAEAALARHEAESKRERAAALLTDAEVDGILDAHTVPV